MACPGVNFDMGGNTPKASQVRKNIFLGMKVSGILDPTKNRLDSTMVPKSVLVNTMNAIDNVTLSRQTNACHHLQHDRMFSESLSRSTANNTLYLWIRIGLCHTAKDGGSRKSTDIEIAIQKSAYNNAEKCEEKLPDSFAEKFNKYFVNITKNL